MNLFKRWCKVAVGSFCVGRWLSKAVGRLVGDRGEFGWKAQRHFHSTCCSLMYSLDIMSLRVLVLLGHEGMGVL